MAQPTNEFTPTQILEAGQRAEAEGRPDYALQFYRHLADYHANSLEADEARRGLARIGPPAARLDGNGAPSFPRTSGPSLDDDTWRNAGPDLGLAPPRERGLSLAPVFGPAVGGPTSPLVLPEPRDHYRASRAIAFAVAFAAWLAVLAGCAKLMAPLAPANVSEIASTIGSGLPDAPVTIAVGLAIALLSRLVRAQFDAANAARELVAIERARTGEVQDPN